MNGSTATAERAERDAVRAVHAPAANAELERMYKTHYALVHRLVVRLGIGFAEAEDVTHNVFVELSSALAKRDEGASERAFLVGITRHVVMRHRRSLFRHIRRKLAMQEHEGEAVAADEHARREAARELHALLESLSEEQRVVFVLMELEEWTAPEVAESLGVKLPTVYSRHRAARLALGEALARRRARERSGP